MFSADLSWTDQAAETVGQRRERRLRNRDHADSPHSSLSDESASRSSFWALPGRRRHNSSRSPAPNSASRKPSKLSLHERSRSRPREASVDAAQDWSAPSQLPCSRRPLLPSIPSIASSDGVREPRSPLWPRSPLHFARRSSVCTIGSEGHYKDKRTAQEADAHGAQQLSEGAYVSRRTTHSTETSPSSHGRPEASFSSPLAADNGAISSSYPTSPDAGPGCNWEAPTDWDIASIRSFSQNGQSFASPFLCDPDSAELTQFQRFVRRMERADPKLILSRLANEMSPDVVVTDPYAEEELAVEKHLWCLTTLQRQNMENSLVPNQGVGPLLGLPTLFRQPKRALELYSNLAEVYQLSAIYPQSDISYLTVRKPLASIPIPSNVHPLLVPSAGRLPLPYPSDSFNHVRCAALSSHLPSPKIQPFLQDIFRMLAPGGILELRLVDSTPVRATMGPKLRAWFEDHLMLNIEKKFLCSRPLALVPGWVKECGLRVLEGGNGGKDLVVQRLLLPACAHPKESQYRRMSLHMLRRESRQDSSNIVPVERHRKRNSIVDFGGSKAPEVAPRPEQDPPALHGELAALVARALWKDAWGSLVDKGSTMGCDIIWWWEDPEIVRECWKYATVFECGTMFAFKE